MRGRKIFFVLCAIVLTMYLHGFAFADTTEVDGTWYYCGDFYEYGEPPVKIADSDPKRSVRIQHLSEGVISAEGVSDRVLNYQEFVPKSAFNYDWFDFTEYVRYRGAWETGEAAFVNIEGETTSSIYFDIVLMDVSHDGITEKLLGVYSIGGDMVEGPIFYRKAADGSGIQSQDVMKGWQMNDAKQWLYYTQDGVLVRNAWIQDPDSGIWYYLGQDGFMCTNQWIDGTYYVGSDGAMLVNATTPDGYQVGADGKWIQEGVQSQVLTSPSASSEIDYSGIYETVPSVRTYGRLSAMDSDTLTLVRQSDDSYRVSYSDRYNLIEDEIKTVKNGKISLFGQKKYGLDYEVDLSTWTQGYVLLNGSEFYKK